MGWSCEALVCLRTVSHTNCIARMALKLKRLRVANKSIVPLSALLGSFFIHFRYDMHKSRSRRALSPLSSVRIRSNIRLLCSALISLLQKQQRLGLGLWPLRVCATSSLASLVWILIDYLVISTLYMGSFSNFLVPKTDSFLPFQDVF